VRQCAVVLVAGAFVAVSAVQGDSSAKPRPRGADVRAEVALRGTEQHGIVLGSPSAPVTLVEFADLQCRPALDAALQG
jgi:protein-disulfide isomerase